MRTHLPSSSTAAQPSRFPLLAFRSWLLATGLSLLAAGCTRSQPPDTRSAMFDPVEMRLHPAFTRVTDWTGDDIADGIEADVELRDRFDDPVKSTGRVIFTLYRYDRRGPDVRGTPIDEPVTIELDTLEQQREHWQSVVRTYRIRLPWPGVSPEGSYVLSAAFDPPRGERLFDQLVVSPSEE